MACRAGNLQNFKLLVEKMHADGVLKELKDRTAGSGLVTPLMNAIQTGDPNMVYECLKIGMKAEARDSQGKSCLEYVDLYVQAFEAKAYMR